MVYNLYAHGCQAFARGLRCLRDANATATAIYRTRRTRGDKIITSLLANNTLRTTEQARAVPPFASATALQQKPTKNSETYGMNTQMRARDLIHASTQRSRDTTTTTTKNTSNPSPSLSRTCLFTNSERRFPNTGNNGEDDLSGASGSYNTSIPSAAWEVCVTTSCPGPRLCRSRHRSGEGSHSCRKTRRCTPEAWPHTEAGGGGESSEVGVGLGQVSRF